MKIAACKDLLQEDKPLRGLTLPPPSFIDAY